MSDYRDAIGAPRDREKALSAAYLRLLGHTQTEAAIVTGVDPRTIGRWEQSSWWCDIQRKAADQWLAGAVGKARRALLRALDEPDGTLALRVLERTVPQLAPTGRVANTGAIAKLDFASMTDEQLSRIKGGENPYVVLAQTRAVLKDPLPRDGEILQLPRGREDGSEA